MVEKDRKRKGIDKRNVMAGAVLVLVLIGVPFGSFFYENNIRKEQLAEENVVQILVYKEESGGWSVDNIELKKGETYTLRFLAIDVTHGFEVEELNISIVFTPSHPKEVTITPMDTGTFEFRCTVYCSDRHSDMKGTLTIA